MALRNIDFEALRSLRDRHGAAFPRGRVVCREGETTSEFYVVLQGSVEISTKDKATGEKRVLFTVPSGGFFGEMSCFSGLPRSATATAAEDSVLLFFTQETAVQLLRASPRFALGVIQTLCDRIRGANERITNLERALAQGGPSAPPATPPPPKRAMPAAVANTAAVAAATARPSPSSGASGEIPPPDYNRQLFWGKACQCPTHQMRFTALNVRPDAAKLKTRDSDFREIYDGANPLWYLVYVCPDCLYAAYPDDFGTLTPQEVQAIAERAPARRTLAGGRDLSGERSREDAVLAFQLAADCYALRSPNAQRLAGLYHRLAWLSRETADSASEQRFIAQALTQYVAALEKERPTDPAAELTLIYTVGELHLRLGNPVEAVKYFAQASQHAEFRKLPDIQRLCRDRWTEARAVARPRA